MKASILKEVALVIARYLLSNSSRGALEDIVGIHSIAWLLHSNKA